MLFRRRVPVGWQEKLRIALWPRRSWGRSTKYVAKRVLRLSGSPHAIAAGIAAGVFASFTPYLGMHFLIAFAVAYLIAGNFIAAATGTFVGNPLSFPFIWAATYSTGNFILTGSFNSDQNLGGLEGLTHSNIWHLGFSGVWEIVIGIWEPVLKPMTVGAIPLGIFFAVIFYVVTRWATMVFQLNRRHKLAEKARQIRERAIAQFETNKTEEA